MIHPGDKFKVHWVGHETCYTGRLYQVVGVIDDCRCARPSWFTGLPETPRKRHCHISAKLIHTSLSSRDEGLHGFNGIDPETLRDIENPDFWLEIVRQQGDQLSLF